MKNFFKTLLIIIIGIIITYLIGASIVLLFPDLVIHTRYGGIISNPIAKSFYLGTIVDAFIVVIVTIYDFICGKL